MKAYLPAEEIRRAVSRFKPTQPKMQAIAFYLHNQTKDRFATHGASSGIPWQPPKWRHQVGHPDGRAILTGRTGGLLKSFRSSATQNEAILSSNAVQAHIHQVGTVGKGGTAPDIKPVNKKMLYIPLNDNAELGWREGLIMGKFGDDGRIYPRNADYILLSRVSIPPRPMLPDSNTEQQAQARFVAETLPKSDDELT